MSWRCCCRPCAVVKHGGRVLERAADKKSWRGRGSPDASNQHDPTTPMTNKQRRRLGPTTKTKASQTMTTNKTTTIHCSCSPNKSAVQLPHQQRNHINHTTKTETSVSRRTHAERTTSPFPAQIQTHFIPSDPMSEQVYFEEFFLHEGAKAHALWYSGQVRAVRTES